LGADAGATEAGYEFEEWIRALELDRQLRGAGGVEAGHRVEERRPALPVGRVRRPGPGRDHVVDSERAAVPELDARTQLVDVGQRIRLLPGGGQQRLQASVPVVDQEALVAHRVRVVGGDVGVRVVEAEDRAGQGPGQGRRQL